MPPVWATAAIDVPTEQVASAAHFWGAVIGADRVEISGQLEQFRTLRTPSGDPTLLLHAHGEGGVGVHIHLHAEAPQEVVTRATGLGAELEGSTDGGYVLSSPGGLNFCVVKYRGEHEVADPMPAPNGEPYTLDQICLDLPRDVHPDELTFWSRMTKWDVYKGRLPEATILRAPSRKVPIQIKVQRLGQNNGPVRAHLDIAAGPHQETIDAVARWHQSLGAKLGERRQFWQAMTSPEGVAYDITLREPDTGMLP